MAVRELYHGRTQTQEAFTITYVRVLRCLQSDISEGAGGWTGSGVPAKGDSYPWGTWTSRITPVCNRVVVDPRYSKMYGRIWAYYSAPRAWGY